MRPTRSTRRHPVPARFTTTDTAFRVSMRSTSPAIVVDRFFRPGRWGGDTIAPQWVVARYCVAIALLFAAVNLWSQMRHRRRLGRGSVVATVPSHLPAARSRSSVCLPRTNAIYTALATPRRSRNLRSQHRGGLQLTCRLRGGTHRCPPLRCRRSPHVAVAPQSNSRRSGRLERRSCGRERPLRTRATCRREVCAPRSARCRGRAPPLRAAQLVRLGRRQRQSLGSCTCRPSR